MGHSDVVRRAYLDRNWTGKVAREELLSKMIHIRETRPNIAPRLSKTALI